MFRTPLARRLETQLCQICEFVSSRQLHSHARRPSAVLSAGKSRVRVSARAGAQRYAARDVTVRTLSTRKGRKAEQESQDRQQQQQQQQQQRQQQAAVARKGLPDLDKVIASVSQAGKVFLSHEGIPSEQSTSVALRTCAKAADVIADPKVHAQLSTLEHTSDTAASTLLSLDANGRNKFSPSLSSSSSKIPPSSSPSPSAPVKPSAGGSVTRLRDVVDRISDTAYAIIAAPNVIITPNLLKQYVDIQARLGRPETLPHVLHLFAAKPHPRRSSSSADGISYSAQNPRRIAAAVEAEVAETALGAAVAAKNLDAAIGVVENSYAAKSFLRAKLLKKAVLPATAFVTVPAVSYHAAASLSYFQNTMDASTATGVAFTGILAYVAFTATIGAVASATANDQMKRVTWTPGTPLRQRWLREEERAALDRVACSFGFSESHRYGEEEGSEFRALREFMMRRGMMLDRVELMEGMN